jgi:hypothetical protein
MAAALLFRDLAVGDRFRFLRDDREQDELRRRAGAGLEAVDAVRILYRTKVSAWHYENTHADGDCSEGRVGVGDQPVVRVGGNPVVVIVEEGGRRAD